ncbi:uncharacterized protein [Amphiura filiformis]|uniref:uncharacterized protein n=1 Tax=Amphiura filiformis TaxID=82378 RepID=UPI003B2116D6
MANWRSRLRLLDIPLLLYLLLQSCTQSTVQALRDVQVRDVSSTSATVSWTTSSDDVTSTVTLQNRDNPTDTWSITDGERSLLLNDLRENSDYIACVVESRDAVNGSETEIGDLVCRQFETPFSDRSIAAFTCATYLIFSFIILTALDFICGSIREDDYELKQEELLEQGVKTFKKTKKAKRKAAKAAQKRQQLEDQDDDVDGDDLLDGDKYSTEPLHDSVVKDFSINQWLESGMGTSSSDATNRYSAPPVGGVTFEDDAVSSIVTEQSNF